MSSRIEAPAAHLRKWFRNASTGELGFLVVSDGRDMICLDRGEVREEHLRAFRAADWLEEQERRSISEAHLHRVAFEADKALCMAVGLTELGRRDWLMMRDEERSRWCQRGPGGPAVRKRLYESIMSTLRAEL